MADSKQGSASGLTADEAKAINRFFWMSTLLWFAVSCLAHYLIWQWTPWF